MEKNNGDALAAYREANVSSQFINNLIQKMDTPQAQSLLNIMGLDKNSAAANLQELSQTNNSTSQVQDVDIERLKNGLAKL
ncbi:MAG: hypothetical protein NC124_02255 [Clostridium sp.]|nr:hypothetical protein [Clostridium sp.]